MEKKEISEINDKLNIRARLLEFFTKYKSEEIQLDEFKLKCKTLYPNQSDNQNLVALYSDLVDRYSEFRILNKRLISFRQKVDRKKLSGILDPDESVKACLDLVYRIVLDKRPTLNSKDQSLLDEIGEIEEEEMWTTSNYKDNVTLLGDFLRELHKTKWGENQKEHFDWTFNLLTEPDSFFLFLSFTRSNCEIINTWFDKVLNEIFRGSKTEVDANWSKINYPASLIFKHLKRLNINIGFFDENSIETAVNIKEQIDKSLGKTLTLIQVINKDSFKNAPDNWPYYEYKKFRKCIKEAKYVEGVSMKSCIFIVTDDILKVAKETPETIPDRFQGWFEEIRDKKDHLWINQIASTAEFESKISEVAKTIIASNKEYINNVPAKAR